MGCLFLWPAGRCGAILADFNLSTDFGLKSLYLMNFNLTSVWTLVKNSTGTQ
ncbi:hypothetical protein EDB95_1216 [Dinghuibacter silviterrae]|uniref:Uncharacterized protein n=1 Tax=Dinghuibacter silviterrae TaxID=1539049 RepID=A0A4R8DQX2_9BACT|nr:hypothetical protein EDB95_1216 [Dinghuibacter silviterrae]